MDGFMKRQTHEGKNGNRPPEQTKWRKGCPSPNPAGRPRIRWFSEAAKAILAEQHPRTQKSGAERLMEMAFRRALQGSYKHLELLLSYAEGKPTQSVDLKVSTLTRDERLVRLNDGELALANALMRKTMLTADEQAQLGVLVWKMGQGSTGKEISAQSVSVDAKSTGS